MGFNSGFKGLNNWTEPVGEALTLGIYVRELADSKPGRVIDETY